MPLYEYECPTCGVFEVEQSMSDDPLRVCPTHPEQPVRKLISRTSFALKGSGWYAQGYSGGGKKPAAGDGETSPAREGAAPSGGKTPPPANSDAPSDSGATAAHAKASSPAGESKS